MATISKTRQQATFTIPADYLEDVRSALVAGVHEDGDRLRDHHADVLKAVWSGTEDRASAARQLREDMHMLDQVLDAVDDTTVTGDREALGHVLEVTVRVLAGRLADRCEYSPIEMGAVLELAGRVRWAAEEAIRVEPELDDRSVA